MWRSPASVHVLVGFLACFHILSKVWVHSRLCYTFSTFSWVLHVHRGNEKIFLYFCQGFFFFLENFPCAARSQASLGIWILLGEARIFASSSPQVLGSLSDRLVENQNLPPLSCSVPGSSAMETAGASRTLSSGQHVRWLLVKPRLAIKLDQNQ